MPHKVFICYATQDKAIADAVCEALESKNIPCWIAPRDVSPGAEWAEIIVDALDQSRILVLILSSNSNISPQVIREIGRAASNGIPIIPFRIDDVSPSKAMEYFISRHQYLDALTPPLNKHLHRLTDTIENMLRRESTPEETTGITETEEAEEKIRSEAEKAAREREKREAKETKERLAEPAKAGVAWLKRGWFWTGAVAVVVAAVIITLVVLTPWQNSEMPFNVIPTDETEEPTTTPPTNSPTTTTPPTTTQPTATASPAATTQPTAVPPPTAKPAPYGTITAAVADFGNEATDPVDTESTWGWMWSDPLIRWDENGNFIPWIAESWTLDGNTWTFKIREGITFHNGDPVTAEDVKFSVDRFGDMTLSSNAWSYYISEGYNKVSSRVVDDYTFEFVSEHPEPTQLIAFAWTRILPKDYYEEVGMDEFRAHPVGCGPWKFVKLVSETSLTLEAYTDYWIPENVPEYQYYVELQVPEQAQRLNMLLNSEADIAFGIDYDKIVEMQDEGFAVQSLGPPGTSSLSIQGSWFPEAGPVSDIRVREAMHWALDHQEIADIWYHGFAYPGGNFYMYPGCFGWSDDLLDGFEYNPQKALELLTEAGYPYGLTIHMYATADQQDYMLLLIGYWENVGINVELEVVDNTTYLGYMFNFEGLQADSPNVGWIFAWTYQGFFNSIYHCSNMYTSWGTHNVGNDPMVDELYLRAAGEVDNELAYQYYNDFQKYVKSQYWNIGIVVYETLYLYNPDTIGEWTGMNWVSYQDALYGIKHP